MTPTPSEPFENTVQESDSIDAIAERFNLGEDGVLLICFANQEVMKQNNGVIFVGQTIEIPPPGSVLPTLTPIPASLPEGTLIESRVLPGDTLKEIAARFNSVEEAIIEFNQTVDPYALEVGQILEIPVNLVTPTPTRVPTSTS
jgi:LysM repeat protein